MPDIAFDEIVPPANQGFDEIVPPEKQKNAFDEVVPPARTEEIKAAPHFLDELKAGRIGSAYYLAKDFIGRALEPTQKTEPGRGEGLLGTSEMIPPDPNDRITMRAAKAIVNVGNRTMSGMTTPEMLPLLVIGGAGGATGRLVTGGFAASQAPQIPEAIKRTIDSPKASQQQIEGALDTFLLGAFTVGAGAHAIRGGGAAHVLRTENFDEVALPKAEPAAPSGAVPPAGEAPATTEAGPVVTQAPAPAGVEIDQARSAIAEREQTLAQSTDPAERQDIAQELVDLRGNLSSLESKQADQTALESAWATVPPMTRDRMTTELRDRGLPEDQISKMSPADARMELAKPAPGAENPSLAPREERPLSPEEIALQQHQEEANAGLSDYLASEGGIDLLEAVKREGGLPSKGTQREGPFSGELQNLRDQAKGKVFAPDLFRIDSRGVDGLVTRLQARGFNIETPTDLFDRLDNRIRTGKPDYALPEQAAAIYAAGTSSPHRQPKALPPGPPTPLATPATAAAVAPVRSWWQQKTLGIRKIVAPQTIDAPARKVANIIRDYNGQLVNTIAQADHALAAARSDFDRTPVPRNWKYDPNKPLPRNYAFIDNSERGGAALSPQDRQLKSQVDKMFSEAVDEVHRVKPAALQDLISNYFPHVWEDPEQAKRVFAEIMGKRPLEGSKGFLKQRVLEYTIDGLKAGLKPISDNPIDLTLTKLHEVHRFVAAQDMLTEAKAIGARKFVYVFERAPDGWIKVDDPTSTVHGPPFVTVAEAFDHQMRTKTIELLDKLGIPHERLARLGGERWGTYETKGGGIKTRFAGPLSVYWHELGHALQEKYGWIDQIAYDAKRTNLGGKSEIEKQFRALADLRIGGIGTRESFKKYIRTKDEKAAVMLETYVHAPEQMRQVAPNIFSRVQKFIVAHAELKAINEIRPNVALGSMKQSIPVGGMVTLGHYYMPEGAAQVFHNYLSPGLQRFGIIRSIRQSTNILSGLQLGFSAFHAGFTSIDAAVSQFAVGLGYLAEGKPIKGAARIATAPLAPVMNYYTGKAVQTAMLDPNWAGKVKLLGRSRQLSPHGQAVVEDIAQLAVKAGLRATVDPFWRTQITRNMVRAWHEGGVKGYAGTVLRVPFAMSEQLMRPILEYLVPRQKLGVFAAMAEQEMQRLGPNADPHAVRDVMARAADATEDRMGQMTYDNLFYNRVLRDTALLGFRAYGWTYGKYRALFGGIGDVIQTPGRVRAGGPLVTQRMTYMVALPMVAAGIGSIMNYAMTGEAPQDWKDMLMPRTGKVDRHGNPQRLSLPTYIKDILSDWHDFPNTKKMLISFGHKLNPWLSVAADVINNADFYGTKIYNEDDPLIKQQLDKVLFVAKSATPFSVTGAARLRESDPSLMQEVLPFFGFVPAKQELSMTPAQLRAAELYQETLPRGARTQDKAEQSRMISQLMRDMKEQDPKWQPNMEKMLASGQLQPSQIGQLFKSMPLNLLQYQVKKLSTEDAMKVWDQANHQEREQLRSVLVKKIAGAKAITPADRIRYYQLLTAQKP